MLMVLAMRPPMTHAIVRLSSTMPTVNPKIHQNGRRNSAFKLLSGMPMATDQPENLEFVTNSSTAVPSRDIPSDMVSVRC